MNHVVMLEVVAKRLAMLGYEQVEAMSVAITGTHSNPPEVSGAVLGLMPHLIERGVLTSSLRADVLSAMCSKFVAEYEKLLKVTTLSNAGFLKRAAIGAAFNTMFRREYDDLKPKMEALWVSALQEGADPIGYVAYVALKRVEASLGRPIESEERIGASYNAVGDLFSKVRRIAEGT